MWFKMYAGRRINSVYTCKNNIMLHYSHHNVLVTEYEELKNKMQSLWAKFLQWKTPRVY